MIDAKTLLPRVPQPVPSMQPVTAPFSLKINAEVIPKAGPKIEEKRETLFSWLGASTKASIKALPMMWKTLAIQLAVVLVINLVFWPLRLYTLPQGIARIVSFIIFLTATYNNIVPKTIYWVILFTFGKRLFKKIRKSGFAEGIRPMKAIVPEFKNAMKVLDKLTWSMLMIGGGIGLVAANNFASYSRFSGARNKMDKYFVAIVISFSVSYILGESKKNSLFKFIRLSIQDLSSLLKKQADYNDYHSFLILSGFVLGLLLDAPLILMKMKYGGYILGVVLLVAGIALLILQKTQSKKKSTAN